VYLLPDAVRATALAPLADYRRGGALRLLVPRGYPRGVDHRHSLVYSKY
jgi:hypothetical protein